MTEPTKAALIWAHDILWPKDRENSAERKTLARRIGQTNLALFLDQLDAAVQEIDDIYVDHNLVSVSKILGIFKPYRLPEPEPTPMEQFAAKFFESPEVMQTALDGLWLKLVRKEPGE